MTSATRIAEFDIEEHIRHAPYQEKTAGKDPAQLRATTGPAPADVGPRTVRPHPRSRHNGGRRFPQCPGMVRQVPYALPQGTSCRWYRKTFIPVP
jgi:hypothetical protein